MIKILFVASNLEHSGTAKQMLLLGMGLPRSVFEVCVCTLVTAGPVAESLREAGIVVQALEWSRWVDIKPFWHFRTVLQNHAPHIVHTWGLPGLRATRLLGQGDFRLVASAACQASARTWLTARLLRRVDRIVSKGPGESACYRNFGVCAEKIIVIPPGVEAMPVHQPVKPTLRQRLRLNDSDRLIVCVGPLHAEKGYYDALWAFDILNYLYDNLHLIMIGSGSYRKRLEEFVHAIQCAWRIHFIGPQPEVMPLLEQADVVWALGRTRGGANVALEAMAAGRPLVASRLPAGTELVDDGATGYLVPAGDKGALARRTRLLLDDCQLARRLGEAGREHVLKQFPASDMVERHARLYQSLVGRPGL